MNIYRVLVKVVKSQKTFIIAAKSEDEAKKMALEAFAKFGETYPISSVTALLMAQGV